MLWTMRCMIAFFCLFVSTGIMAQREAANWYFGTFAGLDFNSGTPVPLSNGQIRTVEGCESFSDKDGNLLFYTEGNSVWNRFHEVMPNGTGLGGSFSTTQSALVVPNPINQNIYYVFTPDDALAYRLGSPNGFNYSIIDMTRDGGRGDVVSKNIDLLPEGSEKVSAVKNPDAEFFWVITHYRDSFYAYRVDGTGVTTTPVVSKIGPLIDGDENIRGALKISPNGQKLAVAHSILQPEYASRLFLYDFDVATGRVSNAQDIGKNRVYYGVEFSSNTSKLYASGMQINSDNGSTTLGQLQIIQFDLGEPNIKGSEYIVHRFEPGVGNEISGNLQIAIDRKIYHSVPNENLSVIRTPNLKGINSDFREFAVDLGDRSATYGLPPFIQSFFETIVTIENFCHGDLTTFTTDSTGDVQSISWDFGDPVSLADNFSTDLNPTHVFSAPGVYTVTIEVNYVNGAPRTFIEFVEIAEIPNVTTQVELVQCDVDGVDDGISTFNLNEAIDLFNNGNEDISALFFPTMNDALANENHLDPIGYVNSVDGETIYARAFENAECFVVVEIVLRVNPMSYLNTYDIFEICLQEPLSIAFIFNITDAYNYLQNDFPDDDSLALYASLENAHLELDELPLEDRTFGPRDELALYFRIENDFECDLIGRLELKLSPKPEFEDEVSTVLCNNEAILTAASGFDSYTWSTGEATEVIAVTEIGEYEVMFLNGNCAYSQKFIVEESQENRIQDIKVLDFSNNNSIIITMEDAEAEDIAYSIDNGLSFQSSNTFQNVVPGFYDIVVYNGCTILKDKVLVGGLNSFFTPNNDGFNDIWALENQEFFPDFRLSIFDKYGKLLTSFGEGHLGWDGNYNNSAMPSDNYWYKLELAEGRVVTGYFALKR